MGRYLNYISNKDMVLLKIVKDIQLSQAIKHKFCFPQYLFWYHIMTHKSYMNLQFQKHYKIEHFFIYIFHSPKSKHLNIWYIFRTHHSLHKTQLNFQLRLNNKHLISSSILVDILYTKYRLNKSNKKLLLKALFYTLIIQAIRYEYRHIFYIYHYWLHIQNNDRLY